MSIYGLCDDTQGHSLIAPLEIAGNGPSLNQLLPSAGWRPFQCDFGGRQPMHRTPIPGMTIVLDGCMQISVSGGSLRSVALQRGDMLLLLDTHGAGHATAILGPDRLRVAGVAFEARDWPAIEAAFTGWPANRLPP